MKFLKFVLMTGIIAAMCPAAANTVIHMQQQVLEFEQAPKLVDVLAKIPSPETVYWPTAALFEHSEDLIQLQQRVVADLNRIVAAEQNSVLAKQANRMLEQISSWRLGKRSEFAIYFERSRIIPALNPRLKEGVFYLSTPQRNTKLPVFGASSISFVDFEFSQQISELYAKTTDSNADKSYIWVIDPDGVANKVGVAYWNRQQALTRPGQQFFIPFVKASLPHNLRTLNEDIVRLLQHRVIS